MHLAAQLGAVNMRLGVGGGGGEEKGKYRSSPQSFDTT